MSHSRRVARETTLTIAAAMIVGGWLLLALFAALGPGLNPFFGGLMFGTLFGHVSLAPLWVLVGFYRLRIVPADDLPTFSPSDQQFGIRQLMILTAIVAVPTTTCGVLAKGDHNLLWLT